MKIELDPCPFCHSEAEIVGSGSGGFKVQCCNGDCGCSLPNWLPFEKDEDVLEKLSLAAEYWNYREPGGRFGK